MVDELKRVGGRASKSQLYKALDIKPVFLEPDSPILKALPVSVQAIDTDFISECFWAKLRQDVSRQVLQNGVLDLVKLANQNSLKVDVLMANVVPKLEGVTFIEGSQELASDDYIEKLRCSIVQHFQSLKEPVVVARVCEDHSWNVRMALDWLLQETKNQKILGEIHLDTESTFITTATFVPSSYTNLHHDEVKKFLESNGFITKARASRHGLSLFKLEQLAKENHENVVVLDDILIIEHMALQKVQVAIHLCMETGIVDLGEYMPAILIRRDIVIELLRRAKAPSNQVVPLVSDSKAILVSQRFQDEIRSTVVLPLVQSFAITRAGEILKEKGRSETEDDEDAITSHGGKKNKSNLRKPKGKHADKHDGRTLVPLENVAKKVIDQYPMLPIVDTSIEEIQSAGGVWSWDDEDDCGYLLIEFCKRVLYTDAFKSLCHNAVQTELDRLQSVKVSKARISRKEAATKLRDVDAAFEECFMNLCYLIQASSKFFQFASGCNELFHEAILKELENELLHGFCADLTSRITQYCLYKHEDEQIFTFCSRTEKEKVENKSSNSNLPSFCAEVDSSGLHPIRSYLSCPPPRDPLPVLRECLDGNKGVTLARQWILCGGECYRGGVRITEGGEKYVREGSIDGFLIHVQENCLTLCGLPFKKLEKKGEKQLLFRRRMALMNALEETRDPAKILDLTIMLLFQQVKHMVVYGNHLRGAILNLLIQDKKISDAVAAMLNGLKIRVEQGLNITEEHLISVKECGLCKDIGKHDIDKQQFDFVAQGMD